MPDLFRIDTPVAPSSPQTIDPQCLEIRSANFPDQIIFHAPGLKRYKTSEYSGHNAAEFVSISITGTACALSCEHCKMNVLQGMIALPQSNGSLFELCAELSRRGARGVLISGGSDRQGRVSLLHHISDLIRVRRELGLTIRVHAGLPDEATCAGLGEVGIDGAMVDIIGHADTIREVYHLPAAPEDGALPCSHRASHHSGAALRADARRMARSGNDRPLPAEASSPCDPDVAYGRDQITGHFRRFQGSHRFTAYHCGPYVVEPDVSQVP